MYYCFVNKINNDILLSVNRVLENQFEGYMKLMSNVTSILRTNDQRGGYSMPVGLAKVDI